jgi:hypothetical protein
MRIIHEEEFQKLKDVKLNSGGREIGEIQKFGTLIVYKKYVYPEHYFIKFSGFGIDRTILKAICIPRNRTDLFNHVDKIVIFYKGKEERRYYMVEPFNWFDNGIPYGTAKESKDAEAYGEQVILPLAKMKLIGYDEGDVEVKNQREKSAGWNKWNR